MTIISSYIHITSSDHRNTSHILGFGTRGTGSEEVSSERLPQRDRLNGSGMVLSRLCSTRSRKLQQRCDQLKRMTCGLWPQSIALEDDSKVWLILYCFAAFEI